MKQFIKDNPFIFIIIIFSTILFFTSIGFCLFVILPFSNDEIGVSANTLCITYSSLYLLGIVIVNFLFIYFKKRIKRQQLIIKIILFITNIVILYYQAFFCLFIIVAGYFLAHPNLEEAYKPITNPKNYKEAKRSISCSKCIRHFPKAIPENARNVKFYKYINWFGAEGIFLGFDIDKDYIENNINLQACRYYSYPNDNRPNRGIYTSGIIEFDTGFMNTEDYTFCVLNPLKTPKTSFIPQYGIVIKQNRIIYYYNKKD